MPELGLARGGSSIAEERRLRRGEVPSDFATQQPSPAPQRRSLRRCAQRRAGWRSLLLCLRGVGAPFGKAGARGQAFRFEPARPPSRGSRLRGGGFTGRRRSTRRGEADFSYAGTTVLPSGALFFAEAIGHIFSHAPTLRDVPGKVQFRIRADPRDPGRVQAKMPGRRIHARA
jgi:hypothetical protein